MECISEQVAIAAPENWALAGTLFMPKDRSDAAGPVILLSGAAAVPHSYYAAHAAYLVAQGAAAVLTYDYRGIAASAGERSRWPQLKMKDWALLDFPAAAAWLRSRFPHNPLVGLGHSYGGQALGLSGVSGEFERYATVATMSGYWRDLDEPWGVLVKTRVVGSAFARLLGHIPSWAGLGETMPGSIFLDWARWISKPDYFFSDPQLPEISRFADVTLPLLVVGLRDDPWGTPKAINTFMANYAAADLRSLWLEPGESGKIGHLGYFRPRHEREHWHQVSDFLLQGIWPDGAA